MLSALNVAGHLGLDNAAKNKIENVSLTKIARLIGVADTAKSWVFEPLELDQTDQHKYRLFFPVYMRLPEKLRGPAGDLEFLDQVPKEISEQGPDRKPSPLGARYPAEAPQVSVSVCGSDWHVAADKAADAVERALDCLFNYDSWRPVLHQFRPDIYLACDVDTKKRFVGPIRFDGVPETAATSEEVKQAMDLTISLENDERDWCRQLPRALHLVRIASEDRDEESRFVHLWRSLEALVGHLTGEAADKPSQSRRLIALCRGVLDGSLTDIEPAKRAGAIVSLLNEVTHAMEPVARIRNQWAIHTGGEGEWSLRRVGRAALSSANKWLKQQLRPLFLVCSDVALNQKDIETREQLVGRLESAILKAPNGGPLDWSK